MSSDRVFLQSRRSGSGEGRGTEVEKPWKPEQFTAGLNISASGSIEGGAIVPHGAYGLHRCVLHHFPNRQCDLRHLHLHLPKQAKTAAAPPTGMPI